tara:strand:+ start:149 stop:472 length:324 start_codon:yes stop_codon:yes gene_type:complete
MNSVNEKEKKLKLALTRLSNFNLNNPNLLNNIEKLKTKKNQLEIEKRELEEKYNHLTEDYNYLSKKLEEFKHKESIEQKKHIQFSEKIDELNQETNTLLEEIDKWQT